MNNYLLEVIIGAFTGHLLADGVTWLLRKNKMINLTKEELVSIESLLYVKYNALHDIGLYEDARYYNDLRDKIANMIKEGNYNE